MSKTLETKILILLDLLSINFGYLVYFMVRVRSGWINNSIDPELWLPMILIYLFWLIVFFSVGLYRPWYAASRFDELTLLFKTSLLGCLLLFFIIFIDDSGKSFPASSRLLIAMYWVILFTFVSIGRLAIRSAQRKMLISGLGVHDTIIVGSESKARELYNEVVKYPALGYRIIGFVSVGDWQSSSTLSTPILGTFGELDALITRHAVSEVLIALDSSDHQHLLQIIQRCNSYHVGLKIMPDLYDIISGQARTNQIYGFPLIEISPQIITPWEESAKRLFDICFSAFVIIVGVPVWIILAILIRLESRGPALYKQERVGKDAKVFNIFKFRSMREDAETAGPQWANKRDVRVTRVGKWLRKLHIDEIPQMWNIFKGEMSLVGPRPERPMFVEQLSKEIPLYPRRLKVRPGLTGWAQVKHKYDESVEDVRKKVQYDLFYIENRSLRMDIKIILSTIFHTLLGRGHT